MSNVGDISIKENKNVYNGIFSDKEGNPDFKGLGPLLKGL